MKYCEEYAALLDLFVDGELPPEEMARVQEHLETCPGCRAYVDDALTLRAGFPEVEAAVVPEGFAEGVMERIRETEKKRGKRMELKRRSARCWAGTLGALAACCALVILVRTGPGGGNKSLAEYQSDGVDTAVQECDVVAGAAAAPAEAAQSTARMAKDEDTQMRKDAPTAGEAANSIAADRGAAKERGITAFTSPAVFESAMDDASESPAAPAALYLTAEEAGNLLDGFTPAWESDEERGYELTGEEYRTLLEALDRQEEPLGEADGAVLVVVTGPFA